MIKKVGFSCSHTTGSICRFAAANLQRKTKKHNLLGEKSKKSKNTAFNWHFECQDLCVSHSVRICNMFGRICNPAASEYQDL